LSWQTLHVVGAALNVFGSGGLLLEGLSLLRQEKRTHSRVLRISHKLLASAEASAAAFFIGNMCLLLADVGPAWF
jgi:hypothetical protein